MDRPSLRQKASDGTIAPSDANDRPEWLGRPVSPPERIRRLQPSRAFEAMEEKEAAEAPAGQTFLDAARQPTDWPLERGRLVHKMLETLPEVRAMNAALPRYATSTGRCRLISPSIANGLSKKPAPSLDDPAFAAVFSERALVEVPVIGQLIAPNWRSCRGIGPDRPPMRYRWRGVDRRLQDESDSASWCRRHSCRLCNAAWRL